MLSSHLVDFASRMIPRCFPQQNFERIPCPLSQTNRPSPSQSLEFQWHKNPRCYVWSIALYGAETWTLRAVDQKHLESFEMWCWRRMEKISWTDHVRNEDVLLRVKEQRNILHEIRKRKANWIGHVLRRNCVLQRVTERYKGG